VGAIWAEVLGMKRGAAAVEDILEGMVVVEAVKVSSEAGYTI
jgi:hypothetical protein